MIRRLETLRAARSIDRAGKVHVGGVDVARKAARQLVTVEFAFPGGDDDGRDPVADEIGQSAGTRS